MNETDPPDNPGSETHFGFKTVRAEDKAGMVRAVFDDVAPSYDLMNDLMSLGIHRLWKSAMIAKLKPRPGMKLLDLGGGTGDIAFRFLDAGGGEVVVCDINKEMLAVGRDRAIDRNRLAGIEWVCGDAENLPFPDRSMDALTIAFCLRNVTHTGKALTEAYRVLRPGAQFLCLEFSHVVLPGLDKIYDGYSFKILPALGKLVAGNRDAYQYLVESIRRFPPQPELAAKMRAAGFTQVSWQNLSGGIAALHCGWRI